VIVVKTPFYGHGIYRISLCVSTLPSSRSAGVGQLRAVLSFPLGHTDIAVLPVVANYLFSLVGHMGGHGRQPLQGVKEFFVSFRPMRFEVMGVEGRRAAQP
jgi:hypothetical protein